MNFIEWPGERRLASPHFSSSLSVCLLGAELNLELWRPKAIVQTFDRRPPSQR